MSTAAYGGNPSTAYYQKLMSEQAATAGVGNQALASLGAQGLGTIGLAGLQSAATQSQLTLIKTETKLSQTYQKAMAGYQAGQLGIAATKIGVEQTGLTQEKALQGTQNQLEQQQYGLQASQYPEQYAQAALTHRNKLTGLQTQQAQSGAQGAVGQKQAFTTLGQQYGFQLQDIGRSQQEATLQQQGALAGQKYSTEQLANAQKNLTLMSKSNGLSQTELVTRLNYSLKQGTLGEVQTIVGLMTKLGGIWSGETNTISGLASLGGYVNGVNMFSPAASNATTLNERMNPNATPYGLVG